jgi:hypothetical protein
VQAVDPLSLHALPEGEPGLARFVDLGNVDSALAVVTQDVITSKQGRVRLCGRAPLAEARGCSLAIEELLYGVTRP